MPIESHKYRELEERISAIPEGSLQECANRIYEALLDPGIDEQSRDFHLLIAELAVEGNRDENRDFASIALRVSKWVAENVHMFPGDYVSLGKSKK